MLGRWLWWFVPSSEAQHSKHLLSGIRCCASRPPQKLSEAELLPDRQLHVTPRHSALETHSNVP